LRPFQDSKNLECPTVTEIVDVDVIFEDEEDALKLFEHPSDERDNNQTQVLPLPTVIDAPFDEDPPPSTTPVRDAGQLGNAADHHPRTASRTRDGGG
jgi:hypothetical protein